MEILKLASLSKFLVVSILWQIFPSFLFSVEKEKLPSGGHAQFLAGPEKKVFQIRGIPKNTDFRPTSCVAR